MSLLFITAELILVEAANKKYREFSPYANFITANFITAVFKNFLDHYLKIQLMQFYGLFILLLRPLAKNLANAIFD